jgi:hypothetical protein
MPLQCRERAFYAASSRKIGVGMQKALQMLAAVLRYYMDNRSTTKEVHILFDFLVPKIF